jgi:hypothetical protein
MNKLHSSADLWLAGILSLHLGAQSTDLNDIYLFRFLEASCLDKRHPHPNAPRGVGHSGSPSIPHSKSLGHCMHSVYSNFAPTIHFCSTRGSRSLVSAVGSCRNRTHALIRVLQWDSKYQSIYKAQHPQSSLVAAVSPAGSEFYANVRYPSSDCFLRACRAVDLRASARYENEWGVEVSSSKNSRSGRKLLWQELAGFALLAEISFLRYQFGLLLQT